MAEFNYTQEEIKQLKTRLRLDIMRAPLELQLLWLFELLMLQSFIILIGQHSKLIGRNPDTNAPKLNEKHYSEAYSKRYVRCLEMLRHYRDNFVHRGFASAIIDFDNLMQNKEDLQDAAKLVKVELNFTNRLF